MIAELLSDRGLLPALEPGVDDVVFAFDDSLRAAARSVLAIVAAGYTAAAARCERTACRSPTDENAPQRPLQTRQLQRTATLAALTSSASGTLRMHMMTTCTLSHHPPR